ncbi:MAG: hypothetical protein DCC57_22685 [Chloroflexi bacterium]|nr:MAG: hypothetical protein DCC57_22685 [Chloroflexota bacterium]
MKLTTATLVSVPITFRIALARILYSHHIFVQLAHEGVTGTGEGVLYRAKPHEAAVLVAGQVQPALQQMTELPKLEDWREQLRAWAVTSPAVAYALDTAWWDIQARRLDKPLAAVLGAVSRLQLPVTEQLFIHDDAELARKLAQITGRGTTHIKLKIGSNLAEDIALVQRVRRQVGPDVELRVDANHAYRWPAAAPLYRQLAGLGVRAFEEPLSTRDWAGLAALRRELGVPVILDESILSLSDLQEAIAAQAIDLLNVKLTRIGGITLAQEYIDLCRRHGVGVLVGCTEDLGIGTAAILHCAAALPGCDSMEGLGPERLGFDVVQPAWRIENGHLALPDGAGLGVELLPAWQDHLPPAVRRFDLTRPSPALRLFSESARLRQRLENGRVRLLRRLRG